MFDLSTEESFNNIKNWITYIKDLGTENSILALVGNKLDITRKVPTDKPQQLAKEQNMLYFETSAKTNENIDTLFYSCVAELPFLANSDPNKDNIIKELKINNKINESSVYDIENPSPDNKQIKPPKNKCC